MDVAVDRRGRDGRRRAVLAGGGLEGEHAAQRGARDGALGREGHTDPDERECPAGRIRQALYRYLATNLPVPEPASQLSPGPFVPYAPERTSEVDVVTGRPLKVEPAWQISLPPVARKVPLLGVTVMPGESFTGVFTSHVALVVPAAPAWGAAANPTSVAAAPTMAT